MRQVTPNIAPPLAVSWPARWTDAVAIMRLEPADATVAEHRLRSLGLLAGGMLDMADPQVEAALAGLVKRAAPKAKAKAAPPPPPLPEWVLRLDDLTALLPRLATADRCRGSDQK